MNQRQVIKSRKNREPGRIVRVPVGEGLYGFGRQLTGEVEFYDLFLPEDETPDLLSLPSQRVLFRVFVMAYAFKRTGNWQLLDVVTLTEAEAGHVSRTWKHDPISGQLSIYWSGPGAGMWGEDPATPEECVGLEQCAVWDPEHVQERLRAHLAGQTVWPPDLCGPFTLEYWEGKRADVPRR